MLPKLVAHVRQNVVAYLALFVALGGTGAYAANTISSTDIVDGEVKSVDIEDSQLGNPSRGIQTADLGDSSVNSVKLKDGAIKSQDLGPNAVAAEPWIFVDRVGGPDFNFGCDWQNFDRVTHSHNEVSFLRDRLGFVHLRGIAQSRTATFPTSGCDPGSGDARIFTFPSGYRPERREVHPVLTNGTLGRINVQGPAFGAIESGGVSIEGPSNFANSDQWISLDGISFRCYPSGQNGCP